MKVPKYVKYMIERRAKLAEDLGQVDYNLSNWLEKNNVITEEYDTRTGCEMYCNPLASARRILKAIEDK